MSPDYRKSAYVRPESLPDALKLLQADSYQILAGGTDFYPALGDKAPASPVLDITAIKDLRSLKLTDSGLEIGSLCTWADIVKAKLPLSYRALQQSAHEVGSVQIQSRATVAGNLCNASPAADGVPPLLCNNASVSLTSTSGSRSVPLADFIMGNRRTGRTAQELVTAITIPASGGLGVSDFLKLGARKYLVISIAMVASRLVIEDGQVVDAAIAVGSCSEVATRLPKLETALQGCPATVAAVSAAVPDRLLELKPIDDVRASADYRRTASVLLVRRSLERCLQVQVRS